MVVMVGLFDYHLSVACSKLLPEEVFRFLPHSHNPTVFSC